MNTIRSKHPRLRLPPECYEQLCRAVLLRDGWRCQSCGSFTNLQIHHKEFRSRSGDDSEDNLITLCSVCHECLHAADELTAPSAEYTVGRDSRNFGAPREIARSTDRF